MLDQFSLLKKVTVGKVVTGTFKGTPFKGVVSTAYPTYYRGNTPTSFTIRLSTKETKGLEMEGGEALFYSSDSWTSKGNILQVSKVEWKRTR